MGKEWFSSPREEALEIAYQTRKDILAGKSDPVAVLRACLVIASDLGKKSAIEWINQELNGYSTEQIPNYRVHTCPVMGGIFRTVQGGFKEYKLLYPVHFLLSYSKKNQEITISMEEDKTLYISSNRIESTLAAIVDRCFQFLNETITELQYGGIVEFLMEEIRRKTDEKLATYDTKITEETQSLYLSLTSTNPADWSRWGIPAGRYSSFLRTAHSRRVMRNTKQKMVGFLRSLNPALSTDYMRSLIRIPHPTRRNS